MAFGGKAYREAAARLAARDAAVAAKAVETEAVAAIARPPAADRETATEALLSGVGKYVFENQRASCHPDRLAFKEGRCYECVAADARRLDGQQKPAAEAHAEVVKLGEEALARQVKGYLQHNLEEYARLHIEATRVAAFKGDARPAEWALQSVKLAEAPVVAAPEKVAGPGGVKVLIGVQFGGLPPGTGAERAITVASEPVAGTNRVTDG